MKTLTPEQISKLKEPLPKEAVSPHPTKTYLSSIKAIYVVERLNDVFGIGAWKLKSKEIITKDKMIVVQSTLTVEEYGIELESYGGNDNADLGDAYKGATTDALTKMASMLEIGMNVFKGLKDTPITPPQEPTSKTVKPMLEPNMVAYQKAVDFISKGGSIDQVKKTYMVTAQMEKEIINAAKTAA